ncbi:MAG: F0F1 ATP synthase subunit alpha, partial [Lentimicrobiaceae bacterium]|nr:F0F1 ATP synthase subunit alpha [Lentimicrobiaceae bacterium]
MSEIKSLEVAAILREQLHNYDSQTELEETGTILHVGDGIAHIYGLRNALLGELVVFDKPDGIITGIVLNLEEDNVGIVLLGDSKTLNEGDICKRTRRIASIKVGEGLLGRVINTIGEPLDGKGNIEGNLYEMPIERKAP